MSYSDIFCRKRRVNATYSMSDGFRKNYHPTAFSNKFTDQGDYDVSHQWFKELGYWAFSPGETIIKYGDIGYTFYVIVKGMVDIYVPFTATVNYTILEFTKLLQEYRDMLLEINEDATIPEPNLQYTGYENYKIIKIKDVIAKLDENQNVAPPQPQKLIMISAKSTDRAFKTVRESLDTGRPSNIRRSSFIHTKTYKINYLKKVARLGVGASFGELALLKGKLSICFHILFGCNNR